MASARKKSKKSTRVPNIDRKYKAFYDVFPGLICTIDEKGTITDVNNRILEYFGYQKEEVTGRSCIDFIADSHKKIAIDSIMEMVQTGIGHSVELLLIKKDNTRFYGMCMGAEITKKQYLVAIENTSTLHHALDDVTKSRLSIQVEYEKLKRANQIVQLTESKYQDLYESSPDLLRSIDLDERVVNCNKTYADKLGYSKEEILGASVFEHTAEKSYSALRDSIKEWKTTGKIVNREIWMKSKDGTEFPTLLSGTNLYNANGDMIGRTVSLRDITNIYESKRFLEEKDRELEQKYQELKDSNFLLVKAEERYRRLYDYSPLLHRTIDINGVIHDCNKLYEKSLGYTKEEIIRKSIFDHIAEKSRIDLEKSFSEWKTNGKTVERTIWLKRKDGTIFPTVLIATSLYDKNGELIGSNTIIRDISDIYSAKQEVEEQKIKKFSALGELSARIAHDMRNPMSTIKNAINLIRIQNTNLDENTLKKFSFIDEAITRMVHQIDDVLDYVLPKPLLLAYTDTDQILQNAINRIIVPDDVKIKLPSNKMKIICDAYKLEIVLVNLITNAVQAMADNGIITIEASEDKDNVMLSVSDTGPGIPENIISKIFDPLFTTSQIGTGLGLTSCKSIVEQHEGSISVSSEVGKGTTFTVRIPKRLIV